MGVQHTNSFTEKFLQFSKKYYVRVEERWNKEDVGESLYNLYSHSTGSKVASFRARVMPGCCGILLVYYLRPTSNKGARGVFEEILRTIIDAAGTAQYGSVLLTQLVDSEGWNACSALGQRAYMQFTNHKTGNLVGIFNFETNYTSPKIVKIARFDGE